MKKVKKILSILLSVILTVSLISQEGIYVYSSEVNQSNVKYIEADSIEKLCSEHDYACNMDKIWVYKAENAAELKVTFSDETALENGADFIYIYDKDDTLINEYTGSQLSGKTVIIPYDTVKIRLVTDETNTAYGFSVTKVAEMTSISVKSYPSNSTFTVGQTVDYTGLELQGNYNDGTNKDIAKSEYSFSEIDNSVAGRKTVTVTYRNLTADFSITIKEAETASKIIIQVLVNGEILEDTSKEIFIDDEVKLNAICLPEGSANEVVWDTHDFSTIWIKKDGTVELLDEGFAEIIAETDNGLQERCEIKIVNDINKTDIKLEPEVLDFTARPVKPSVTIKYGEKVLEEDDDYLVEYVNNTNIGEGKVIIEGMGRYSGEVEIPFLIKINGDISISKNHISLEEGDTYRLYAKYNSVDISKNKGISWTSSDESIAEVSKDGVVEAVSAGTCIIKASIDGKEVSCKVDVKEIIYPNSIKISKKKSTLYVGEKERLTAKVLPADTDYKDVIWYSSNPKVADVYSQGTVVAKSAGKAVITVETFNDITAECVITVKEIEASKIKLNRKAVTLNKGKSVYLKATISPKNTTDKTVKWSSDKKSVATVDSEGKVTARKGGTATITAKTKNGKTAKCKVNVKEAAKKVKLSKTSVKINKGEKLKLKAVLYPASSTDKIKWTSSNKKVATVSNNGIIKGIKAGKATITAKATSGKKATCRVTVKAPAKKISLNTKHVTLKIGDTFKLRAKVSPKDTTDKVKWSSSNSSVATVNGNGVVSAIRLGTAKITARTTSGKKVTCTVKVETSSKEENIRSLKKYINKYGSVDNDGNKYIGTGGSYSGSDFLFCIFYDLANDRLEFAGMSRGTVNYTSYISSLNMYLGDNNAEYTVIFGGYTGFKSNASFDFSTYDGKGNIHFDLVQSTANDITESDIQELANVELQLSFKQWDMLIREKTGMGMRDIGFGAYSG
ncbi:MAG: Ig-like domain-containing protein [Lachnospiraceae bacterium]|nr:Ig-like domain-containing protein [Lachnospiraceae bacterium]